MSLLEQNSTRKAQVDEITFRLKFEIESNGKAYEVEAICDNVVYAGKLESHLLGLY